MMQKRLLGSIWLMVVVVLGAACSASGPPRLDAESTIAVSGALAYRERIALSPGGQADVVLSAVGAGGSAGAVLARQTRDLGSQQVPIDFSLVVVARSVRRDEQYVLQGFLRDAEGRLRWSSDPVPVGLSGKRVDLGSLRLLPVASLAGLGADTPLRTWRCGDVMLETGDEPAGLLLFLEGRAWRLTPVEAASGARYEGSQGDRSIVFWSKGDQAQVDLGGQRLPECVAD